MRLKSQIWSAALLWAGFGQCFAAQRIEYERHVLPNGLTVILHSDDDPAMPPIAAVEIRYNVGSKHEEKGLTGLAHFFEHYMFRGNDLAKTVNHCGGNNNAFTSQDATHYVEMIPSDCLERVLEQEASRLCRLRQSINADGLKEERDVVKNEKKSREEQAYGTLYEEILRLVYPPEHPYHHEIIGSMEDLDSASIEAMKEFHGRFYNPNNAILAVAGRHDKTRTLDFIKDKFAACPAGQEAPKAKVPPFQKLGGRRERRVEDGRARLTHMAVAFSIPGRGHAHWLPLSVLSSILGGGRNTRLTKLHYEKKLVADLEVYTIGREETDLLIVEADLLPGATPEQVEREIRAELDKLVKDGIEPEEIEQILAGLHTHRLSALQEAASIASSLVSGQSNAGDPLDFEAQLERMKRMEARELQGAAAEYLNSDNSAVIIFTPKSR
ncbi:MAG: insulinase family protein [Elusimicrobia bacterium]|nr:insulinase family protein [Elusimicrobiota bacterium]